VIIEIIVLLLGIPVGYLLAYLARDELVVGRKWFKALVILGVVVGGWFALTGDYAVAWSSGFIAVTSFVSVWKSYDKKWVKA